MSRHGATTAGGTTGMPSPSHGEEHTSIGSDPLAGPTTDHDVDSPSVGSAPETAEGRAEGDRRRGGIWLSASGPGPGVVEAGALDGRIVESPTGDELGHVVKLMVDLACGRLAYLVVELTPFAGGRLCAVPWPAITVAPRSGHLSIAFSPDDLHQAPTFTRESWPAMADERWAEEVHAFFGSRPYWV